MYLLFSAALSELMCSYPLWFNEASNLYFYFITFSPWPDPEKGQISGSHTHRHPGGTHSVYNKYVYCLALGSIFVIQWLIPLKNCLTVSDRFLIAANDTLPLSHMLSCCTAGVSFSYFECVASRCLVKMHYIAFANIPLDWVFFKQIKDVSVFDV